MSTKIKKTINRIIVFILSLPFAFVVLSPLLILYGLILASYPEGREKLKGYYSISMKILNLIIGCFKADTLEKRKKARAELWLICKNYWNGKN